MNFLNEKIDDVTMLLTIKEERLDSVTAPAFREYFIKFVDEECKKVLLDFSYVKFMDSSGLGVLITSLKSMGKAGDIILVGLQGNVQGLITLTRMDRLFPQFETLAQALETSVALDEKS